ncbi:MAG: thiamine pyrophosphate-dependent enzyme [Firmicutes bacterium]|nr:thiamine pyrophosphate-dependent enzyme [Bacillota bacterium]
MPEPKEFNTTVSPTWCPGCGNFAIWNAVKVALSELNVSPDNAIFVYGIGCSGNTSSFINVFGFHGIHGRSLPVATGIKLANHEAKVVAHAGDGDAYGIGACHFIHAMRRNIDITYIVHDNQIYGLTTGQASPTSLKGFRTKSTPEGVIDMPLNPIALAIDCGATYIARGYSGELKQLTQLIKDAITHKGFSLVDVFQPCVTFNFLNTYQWFQKKVYKLEDESHNPQDRDAAHRKAMEWGDRIPIGLFYKESRLTYEDELPQIKDMPLVRQSIEDIDISKLMEEYV